MQARVRRYRPSAGWYGSVREAAEEAGLTLEKLREVVLTQDDVVRHVLEQIDADPDAISAQVEEESDRAERTDVAPSLSPDAKAALLAAYEESRELGSSYVGPEHVLLALARDTDSYAGELLERGEIDARGRHPRAALR